MNRRTKLLVGSERRRSDALGDAVRTWIVPLLVEQLIRQKMSHQLKWDDTLEGDGTKADTQRTLSVKSAAASASGSAQLDKLKAIALQQTDFQTPLSGGAWFDPRFKNQ